MATKRAVWDTRLVCKVKTLSYDFRTGVGEIHFPPFHCCDMDGCIKLFTAIDPKVKDIQTYSGEKMDTRYTYSFDEGRWIPRCYQ